MFGRFYKSKRVLVTGAAGVKGTWLCAALLEAGADVTATDVRQPSAVSNFHAGGIGKKVRFITGDVSDLGFMRELVDSVDAVFHLAAVALVHQANRDPLRAYSSNTLGTAAVLEAIRLARMPKYAVFVTTDKVYRPKNGELWVETDELGASGPYAVSKACAELIIADYNRSYLFAAGNRVAVGRAGNVVIGGDLNSSATNGGGRIFVDCFEALAANRPPEIFTPSFTRPYTYGLDVIAGYMTLMSRLDSPGVAGEAFNFGPYEQFGVSNSLLATKICELWGNGPQWRSGTPREEPFAAQSLAIDKSRERLGWRPAFTLYESLAATTRWYKAWYALEGHITEGAMEEVNRTLMEEHRTAARNLGLAWTEAAAGADSRS